MRATRFSHLNDSQEFKWSQSKLNEFKEKLCNDLGIVYDGDATAYPYVICFSELPDELLMWKLYGKQGQGFMLTLDYDVVKNYATNWNGGDNPDILQSITYANDDDWFEKFMGAYSAYCKKLKSQSSNDLDEVCALIKRDIYEHEHEIRYMRVGHDTGEIFNPISKEIKDLEFQQKAQFRDSAYGLTPFIEMTLPKEALKSITVGYAYNFQAQKEALELLLYQRNYKDVKIKQSNIKP